MLPATNCYVAVFTAHLLHISMENLHYSFDMPGYDALFLGLHATPS